MEMVSSLYNQEVDQKREMIYNKKLLGLIPWSSNEEKLLQLKGKYNGKIAFIIGNGPSLRMEDLETLKNNHIFVLLQIV